MSLIKVAAIQMDSQNDKDSNLKKAEQFIRLAASQGASFVALPEYFNFMGTPTENLQQVEEVPGGKTAALLSGLAKELGIWLHGGSMMEQVHGEERAYNTTLLFNPEGKIHAVYRKIHLFDVSIANGPSSLESAEIKSGCEIVVADTDFARIGLSICYDIRFPELFGLLTMEGAEVLLTPAAFTLYTGKDHWETILRTRAIENQAYVIAPGQIGTKASGQCYGRTMIIDPWGTVMTTASDKETIVTAEIDLDYLRKIRQQVPSLQNRRPDMYTLQSMNTVNFG